RAAEPLAGGDDPLGVPIRRDHRHAAQLALHRRGARFLRRRRRGEGDRLRGGLRRGRALVQPSARTPVHRGRRGALAGFGVRVSDRREGARGSTARNRPGLVGDALYLPHHPAPPSGGAPRRQRAARAAALAHVAQNLYAAHERTLGAMPLYHTMGVRSLLAMSLIGGAFVCLPRFDVARALELIAAERITNLYLVPTLYH